MYHNKPMFHYLPTIVQGTRECQENPLENKSQCKLLLFCIYITETQSIMARNDHRCIN